MIYLCDGQECVFPDLIEEDDEKQHIFISYQWNNQETVLRIRDSLIKNGYKVWMDVDAMSKYGICSYSLIGYRFISF